MSSPEKNRNKIVRKVIVSVVYPSAAVIYSNGVAIPHSVWIPVHLHYKVICVHTWLPAPLSSCAASLYCRKLLCITLLYSLIPYLSCYWHNLYISILHRRPQNRYASIMYVLLFSCLHISYVVTGLCWMDNLNIHIDFHGYLKVSNTNSFHYKSSISM